MRQVAPYGRIEAQMQAQNALACVPPAVLPRNDGRVFCRPALQLLLLASLTFSPACSLFQHQVTPEPTPEVDRRAQADAQARQRAQSLAEQLVTDYHSQAMALLPVLATQQLDTVTGLVVEWYDVMTEVFPTSATVWAEGMPQLHDVRQRAHFQQENVLRGGVWEHGLPAQVASATAALMDTMTQYELDREALGSLPPERWLELRDAYNGWIEVLRILVEAAIADPTRAWVGDDSGGVDAASTSASDMTTETPADSSGSDAGQGVLPDEL